MRCITNGVTQLTFSDRKFAYIRQKLCGNGISGILAEDGGHFISQGKLVFSKQAAHGGNGQAAPPRQFFRRHSAFGRRM